MTEKEKCLSGRLYRPDRELGEALLACKELCGQYNQPPFTDFARRAELLRRLLPNAREGAVLVPPFWCDYGDNIRLGEGFFANHNCVMLDAAPVTFGKNVLVGPNCCFSTSGHPLDAARRGAGLEFALPITVGDDVWFGANVTVLPGVTIGDRAVIGAGSVVNRNIPSDVVAAGNPCRVLRPITEADARREYP